RMLSCDSRQNVTPYRTWRIEGRPHAALALRHIALFRLQNVDTALNFPTSTVVSREILRPSGSREHHLRPPASSKYCSSVRRTLERARWSSTRWLVSLMPR